MVSTPKRGKKAPPKSKPGAWDKPPLEASATKKGPGRKAKGSTDCSARRTLVAPPLLKKLRANIGHNPFDTKRRVWRDGEPMHVVKPVRAARRAAAEAEKQAERA